MIEFVFCLIFINIVVVKRLKKAVIKKIVIKKIVMKKTVMKKTLIIEKYCNN